MAWSNITAVGVPAYIWQILSPSIDSEGGVDFAYEISDDHPFRITSETGRAIPISALTITEP